MNNSENFGWSRSAASIAPFVIAVMRHSSIAVVVAMRSE